MFALAWWTLLAGAAGGLGWFCRRLAERLLACDTDRDAGRDGDA
jgi:hypothetical protein